jgi:hypothetical protein
VGRGDAARTEQAEQKSQARENGDKPDLETHKQHWSFSLSAENVLIETAILVNSSDEPPPPSYLFTFLRV